MKRLIISLILLLLQIKTYSQTEQIIDKGFFKNIYAGIDISTTGLGISGIKTINKYLDIRLMGSVLGYSYDLSKLSSDLQGKARLRIGNVGLLADLYFLRFAYLSAGITHNLTKISLHGQMANPIEIGDIEILPDQIGDIDVTIKPGFIFNPYLGAGLNFRRGNRFSFGLEGGLFFIGKPDVKLKATGMLEPTASQEQEELMESNISPLIYYPYFSIRLAYRIR